MGSDTVTNGEERVSKDDVPNTIRQSVVEYLLGRTFLLYLSAVAIAVAIAAIVLDAIASPEGDELLLILSGILGFYAIFLALIIVFGVIVTSYLGYVRYKERTRRHR